MSENWRRPENWVLDVTIPADTLVDGGVLVAKVIVADNGLLTFADGQQVGTLAQAASRHINDNSVQDVTIPVTSDLVQIAFLATNRLHSERWVTTEDGRSMVVVREDVDGFNPVECFVRLAVRRDGQDLYLGRVWNKIEDNNLDRLMAHATVRVTGMTSGSPMQSAMPEVRVPSTSKVFADIELADNSLELFVNGRSVHRLPVRDTRYGSSDTKPFEVPLRAGKNHLAFLAENHLFNQRDVKLQDGTTTSAGVPVYGENPVALSVVLSSRDAQGNTVRLGRVSSQRGSPRRGLSPAFTVGHAMVDVVD